MSVSIIVWSHTLEINHIYSVIMTRLFQNCSNLKCHLGTHSGEKPYQCNLCGMTFSISSKLKSHMRSHTGDKPYKRSYCDEVFSTNSHLKCHIWTHNGKKPQ
ncbi:unnamed protein product, partial [Meganyctiphanes norvegica]